MATGTTEDRGGIAAVPDLPQLGMGEWAQMSGYAQHGIGQAELSGGPGIALDQHVMRIQTSPTGSGMTDNVHGAGHGLSHLDTWQDVANLRGSPVGWVLIFMLFTLGFAQFRIMARAGKARGSVALG